MGPESIKTFCRLPYFCMNPFTSSGRNNADLGRLNLYLRGGDWTILLRNLCCSVSSGCSRAPCGLHSHTRSTRLLWVLPWSRLRVAPLTCTRSDHAPVACNVNSIFIFRKLVLFSPEESNFLNIHSLHAANYLLRWWCAVVVPEIEKCMLLELVMRDLQEWWCVISHKSIRMTSIHRVISPSMHRVSQR